MLGGLFFLHYNLNVTGSLGYQFGSLWTTPWPHKISLFFWKKNTELAIKSIFPIEIPSFFLGKLGGPLFLQYNLISTGSLGYQFGSLWTTPWPDEKDLFLKFVIREIRKFLNEKLTFFLRKL